MLQVIVNYVIDETIGQIPMGDIELDNVESFVNWMKNQKIENGDGDQYHYEAHRFDTGPLNNEIKLMLYFEPDS